MATVENSAAPLTKEQAVADIAQAINSGNLPKGIALARAALARGLVHPLFLNLRANWLDSQNRTSEALADLELAVKMAPQDGMQHVTLGLCLIRSGRWIEAAEALEIAVRYQPDYAPAHFNLGAARECTGDLNGARAAFERALEIKPDYADPLASLANLAARRGDWTNARMLAEKALALDPKQHIALTALAGAAIATGDFASADALIGSVLADASLPTISRAMFCTLNGDMRHAEGRYADAFSAYTEGNTLRRQTFASQFAASGRETAATYVQWLTEYFAGAPAQAWTVKDRPKPSVGPRPMCHVLLMGFARSGTTLLENILATHPGITTLEEKEVLVDAIRAFLSDDDGADRLLAADEAALDKYRELYWKRVADYGVDASGKVFIDKRPMAAMKLPVIARLFPEAKILFALRDPRDVILSCYRRQFLLNPSMYQFLDLRGAARYYSAMMQLAAICREKFGQPWQETRHEALIADFDAEIRRILDFIGVEWNDEVRDFAEKAKARAIATPSSTQVIKGLNREGVGQWRHYREQLAPILPTLRPWIEKFGYPPY